MDVEKKDAPYGMDKITTDGGTVFYRNKNGIFVKRAEKIKKEIGTSIPSTPNTFLMKGRDIR